MKHSVLPPSLLASKEALVHDKEIKSNKSNKPDPPRPSDAWILFRSDAMRAIKNNQLTDAHAKICRSVIAEMKAEKKRSNQERKNFSDRLQLGQISRIAAAIWKHDSELRSIYRSQAEKQKWCHSLLYPGYKFKPRRRNKKVKQIDAHAASTSRMIQDPPAHIYSSRKVNNLKRGVSPIEHGEECKRDGCSLQSDMIDCNNKNASLKSVKIPVTTAEDRQKTTALPESLNHSNMPDAGHLHLSTRPYGVHSTSTSFMNDENVHGLVSFPLLNVHCLNNTLLVGPVQENMNGNDAVQHVSASSLMYSMNPIPGLRQNVENTFENPGISENSVTSTFAPNDYDLTLHAETYNRWQFVSAISPLWP